MQKHLLIGMLLITLLGLAACTSQGNGPEKVVEAYLEALVALDDVQAVNLSCASWEEFASAEGAAFIGVEVTLEDAVCSVVEQDSESATVTCTGQFVFSYAGGEDETLELNRRDYHVVFEGSEWRMCGYK